MVKATVLIADDDPALVHAISERCHCSGFNVVTAANGLEAILKIKKQLPDLLIVDIDMPHADGFKVVERLHELCATPLPVIVLTGMSDTQSIRRCGLAGAHYLLKDHDTWNNLAPLLTQLTSATPPRSSDPSCVSRHDTEEVVSDAPKVLVVDDDRDVTRAIKIRLSYYGVETFEASDGLHGYNSALANVPDVIVTDYNMPQGSGDHMMVRLKQSAKTKDIPIIVLTGETDASGHNVPLQREIMGRRGAAAFLAKPLDFDTLIAELQRHIESPLTLKKKSSTAGPLAVAVA